MNSRWFLFGAVVGFVLLLFEMGQRGSAEASGIAASGTSATGTGTGTGCDCGCGKAAPIALLASPSETPPASPNQGGAGTQYGPGGGFQWQNIGHLPPVGPYTPPIIAQPVTVGSGGGSQQQYGNAIPGRTQSFAVPGNGVIQ